MKILRYVFTLITVSAASTVAGGEVTLALEDYERLIAQARQAPTGVEHVLTGADLAIALGEREEGYSVRVDAQIRLRWSKDTPGEAFLLPRGAIIESAILNGQEAAILARPEGYFVTVAGRGDYSLSLGYEAEVERYEGLWSVALPTPFAARTSVAVSLPGNISEIATNPALRRNENTLRGNIASTSQLTMTWRGAASRHAALTSASYVGEIVADAVRWRAQYTLRSSAQDVSVEFLENDTIIAAFDAPDSVVLTEEQGRYRLHVTQPGTFTVRATLESPIDAASTAPKTVLDLPESPINQFTLTLPGDRDVQVAPRGNVTTRRAGESTVAEFFVEKTARATISWVDAIPEDLEVERRMSATVYQALGASEGLLVGAAELIFEISRGSLAVGRFSLPDGVNVNRVESDSVAIADWFVEQELGEDGRRRYQVYLAHPVSETLRLLVDYEALLPEQGVASSAPLILVEDADRQKGMLALLSGRELALDPGGVENMAPVGENQLPAAFRERLQAAVSHTFKYHQTDAALTVAAVPPRREPARFDVNLSTLVSVGEVALRGQLAALVDVKSGTLENLDLNLPAEVNVLSVTGPAIRQHELREDGQEHVLHVEFTRELDGRFQIDVTFERIVDAGASVAHVPQFSIQGADVEHGLIAIEALAALEITVSESAQLNPVDISELPRALLLKTTNPILHAFRYVRSDAPPRLALEVTRHQEVELKDAIIDSASYLTLVTRDGLAVTRATFSMRNSRRQFLRLAMPEGASIWSAFVGGEARKPAQADNGTDLLVKMVNSATPFEVELVYAVQGSALGGFGTVEATLPQPDVVVTRTDWQLFVPRGPRYSEPESNLDLAYGGPADPAADLAALAEQPGALKIDIPTEGVRYRFAKLYADQSGEPANVKIPYVTGKLSVLGTWLGAFGALALMLALVAYVRIPRHTTTAALVAGAAVAFAIAFGVLGGNPAPAMGVVVVGGVMGAGYGLVRWWRARNIPKTGE